MIADLIIDSKRDKVFNLPSSTPKLRSKNSLIKNKFWLRPLKKDPKSKNLETNSSLHFLKSIFF